jgi:hypothetical protein
MYVSSWTFRPTLSESEQNLLTNINLGASCKLGLIRPTLLENGNELGFVF